MRTLNRPMFNMGGPIKEGIMNNIREPYAHGQLVQPGPGRPGYKGIPKSKLGAAGWLGKKIPFLKEPITKFSQSTHGILPKAWQRAKNLFGTTTPAQGELYKTPFKQASFAPNPVGKYLAGTPEWWAAKKIYQGKGLIAKPIKYALKSPLLTGVTGYQVGKHLLGGDKKEKVVEGIMKPGGYPGAGTGGGDTGMTSAQQEAFALAQRNKRVKKYLDLMGYDRSKKTAIADALIDASKIVSDRGTLDLKNITGELINPVIQATSKRLDKPEQIREAVGLMMTKAGLEKEMYEAKPGTVLKNVQDMVKSGQYTEEEAWAIATKGSQGAVADLQSAISTGKVDAANWPSFVMSTGALHGEEVTHVTDAQLKEQYKDLDNIPSAMEIITEREKTEIVPDGIYVIGQETVRIKGGKKTKIK